MTDQNAILAEYYNLPRGPCGKVKNGALPALAKKYKITGARLKIIINVANKKMPKRAPRRM